MRGCPSSNAEEQTHLPTFMETGMIRYEHDATANALLSRMLSSGPILYIASFFIKEYVDLTDNRENLQQTLTSSQENLLVGSLTVLSILSALSILAIIPIL